MRKLKDLAQFSEASTTSWNSLRLLWALRKRYGKEQLLAPFITDTR